jgi:hypothetical protein
MMRFDVSEAILKSIIKIEAAERGGLPLRGRRISESIDRREIASGAWGEGEKFIIPLEKGRRRRPFDRLEL